jgi:3-oxoacyl-[acyl-carrier-protein] synthase II
VRRAIVVTGAGLISAIGDSPADLHRALTEGRRATAIDAFDAATYLGPRNARPLDRLSQLAAAAAGLTLADAGWTDRDRAGTPVGLVLGTVFSGVRTICAFDRRALEAGAQYVSPLDFANTVLNAAAGQVAIWLGLRGPNVTVSAGAASGLQAIACAADLIASGAVDAAIAGGADERSPEAVAALRRAGVTRDEDEIGEAAAFVLLETKHGASARGAGIRAEIRGLASGRAGDGDGDPAPDLLAAIVRGALADAGLGADAIDAVSAAAGGCERVNEAEARALSIALCGRRRALPMLTVTSAVGETLGASGALQTIAAIEAMRRQPADLRTVLIDAVGRDGNACALIVGAPEDTV